MDVISWRERWRAGIRLGETAVVIGLWGCGIASVGDVLIATILLLAALTVSVLAIATDDSASRRRKGVFVAGAAIIFLSSIGLVSWRSVKPDSGEKVVQQLGRVEQQRNDALAALMVEKKISQAEADAPHNNKEVIRSLRAGKF